MASFLSSSSRAIRIVAAFLIALAVAFVAIGFVNSSVTVETASSTDRSPYVAFQVLTDSNRLNEWMDGFVSMDSVLDRDTPVGNVSMLRMVSGKDTLEMRQEVIEFEPGERFVISFESDITSGTIDVQLIPVTGGTELFVRSRFEGSSWFWRSLFPLMKSEIRRTQQSDYDRLASLVDASPIPIEGNWAGVDAQGNEQLFRFSTGGRLDWRAASEGEWFELDGLQYVIDRSPVPAHIDLFGFSGPPLEGMVLFGIVDFISDDSLRLDLEPAPPGNSSARPGSFTESTVELRRVR